VGWRGYNGIPLPFAEHPKHEEAADRGLEGGCVALAWKADVYNLTPAASVPVGASRPRVCPPGLPGCLVTPPWVGGVTTEYRCPLQSNQNTKKPPTVGWEAAVLLSRGKQLYII